MLAAPTIATHGTRDQIERYIPDLVTGRRAWCQLFSEPGAGSDLAGLTTRAVRDGDLWHVNGQKVWTSGGQIADLGMLIARTNPDAPKHQGHHLVRDRHAPAGRRDPAAARDDRPRDVQRGLPHRRSRPRRRADRRCQQRLGGREHDTAVRALGHGRGWWRAGAWRVDGTAGNRRRALAAARGRLRGPRPQRRQRQRHSRTAIDGSQDLHRPREVARSQRRARDPPRPRAAAHAERARALQHRAPQGRAGSRRRHPWPRELHQALDGRRRAAAAATSASSCSARAACSMRTTTRVERRWRPSQAVSRRSW